MAIAPGSSTCPIAALDEWLTDAGIDRGPVFRPMLKGGRVGDARLSDCAVAEIVKKYAGRVGLDPTSFSGHSLRAGFLTSVSSTSCLLSLKDRLPSARHTENSVP